MAQLPTGRSVAQLSDAEWCSQCPPPTPHSQRPATTGSAAAATKGDPPRGTFVTIKCRLTPQGPTASPLPQLGKGKYPGSGRARLPGSPDRHHPAARAARPSDAAPLGSVHPLKLHGLHRLPPSPQRDQPSPGRERVQFSNQLWSRHGPITSRPPTARVCSRRGAGPARRPPSSDALRRASPKDHRVLTRPQEGRIGPARVLDLPRGAPTSSLHLPLTSPPSGRLLLHQDSSSRATAPPWGRSNSQPPSMPHTPLRTARQHRRAARLSRPRPTRLRSGPLAI
ncbi:hypothetical protein NDU88_000013 [Pleurodeles waltl]|uniref:Uncharacterized protein n=1 Tax=Pleurodeles waltl TaxID=8319 RepID=A0AAV7TEN1_PLEWA|nr:hypothetical protein NDU88_000013 [Pleurodeles waltl]